jgi:hypothetical protein
MITHYPAPHQNFKATRSCKTGLPPDLGVKQAKPHDTAKLQSHSTMEGKITRSCGCIVEWLRYK